MGQAEVLNLLKKYPEGLTAAEITIKLKTNRPLVNVAIRRLLKAEDIFSYPIPKKGLWISKYTIPKDKYAK